MKATKREDPTIKVATSNRIPMIASATRLINLETRREWPAVSVAMRMVRVRNMWMRVPQRLVTMPMAVGTGRHRDMHMVVVPVVVTVCMFVLRHFVCMLVTVRLREVEYHPCEHQYAA